MGWENYGVPVGNSSDPGDKSYSLADRSAAKVTHWLTGNLANREIFKNFYEYKIIKKPIKGNDLTFVASIIPNKEKQLSQYLQ